MKTKLLILLIILGLAACTKYDEGPKISFRNTHHLLLGHWVVSKYVVNSIDSTEYYLDHRACVINIYHDFDDYFNLVNCKDVSLYNTVGMAGFWLLDKNKNKIVFYATDFENYWSLFNTTLFIKRLTKDELFLETYLNQNHYRLELTK